MTPEQIIEGNKLIAGFMGKEANAPSNYYYLMLYDRQWDDLMHVVDKIEGVTFVVEIVDMCCSIKNRLGDIPDFKGITRNALTKIEAVYLAVIQFITWYNQQPK